MRQPSSSEWSTIWRLFDRLVSLPADEQEPALARAAVEPFVADQVRSLLRAGDSPGPLDGQAPGAERATTAEYSSLASGTTVGAFRVLQLIGRGGMGEVYLAERTGSGFDQRVALKMLRPEAVARASLFESERQLLATLEHPGIARLIDGGIADDGRAYMAMEYVEGEDIGRWCARTKAGLDERLRLFLALCDAVSYAHARLVVHRDIKLANILIDTGGRLRLLDFGIARIADEAAGDHTMTLAMLTPDYAAPEQLENARVTVATDVYALGAVLYELLTGTGPWRAGAGSVSSIIRRALHDDPVPPSKLAREVGESPVPAPRIAGDLDAIVMKAMRHAPADRYASVADLADDIRRHQRLRPVRAHAGSSAYRVRRFVQRNTLGVVAGGALALALLAGAGGIAWQARQAAIERDIARAELRRSEAAFNAISYLFRNASETGQIGSVTAREMLDASARKLIATSDPDDPDTADAVITLADLYILTEDVAGAESFLRQAMDAGVGRTDTAATARIQHRLGQAYAATGRPDEARALLDRADGMFRADPERFRTERADALGARAYMLRVAGKRDEAIKLLEDGMPAAEAAYADNPREMLTRYANLGAHYIESGRIDDAERILDRGAALATRERMEASAPGLMILTHRATTRVYRGDLKGGLAGYERAASLRRELYGSSAGLGFALMQAGGIELALGQDAKALATFDEAWPMIDKYLGLGSPPGLALQSTRVEALANLGRRDDARRSLARAEADFAKLGAPADRNPPFLRARAAVRIADGQYDDARADLDAAEKLLTALGRAAGPSLLIVKQHRSRLR
ncbi:serine/threonine protein kinase [Sphingopyxis sp. PAMC25046]|uniref:serine/threonine-protein kinase n=1 Tax=Sphingopyxis sp. PAMC25046 TaxID=2565556 RepID=UPI00109DF28F|nr:serine/threonine-protein kinase [Sphingopyxis sp. PAMC25046]QCB55613.1 serine/threonine protein kinase [Sphingopyxis sp. PAMC25046]